MLARNTRAPSESVCLESLYILMIEICNLEVYIARCLKDGIILLKLETLPVIGHNCVLHWGFIVKPTEIQFDKKKTQTGALFCKLSEVHSVNEVSEMGNLRNPSESQ